MIGSVGVHVAHCCKWHGCKYSDPNCPVVSGEAEQLYLCEDCYETLDEEEYYKTRLLEVTEIKAWQAERIEKRLNASSN